MKPAIGGCTVLEDPGKSGAETLVFWRPEVLPALVRLSPAPRTYTGPGTGLDPWWGMSRQAIFHTAEGFHVALAEGPRERRFWIEGKRLPRRGTPLRALIALDCDLDAQVAALRRFHDSVTNPAAPPRPDAVPDPHADAHPPGTRRPSRRRQHPADGRGAVRRRACQGRLVP